MSPRKLQSEKLLSIFCLQSFVCWAKEDMLIENVMSLALHWVIEKRLLGKSS